MARLREHLAAFLLHEPARLLTVREVAQLLAVSAPIVYRLCERGQLAHARVSNAIRIAPADLADYIAARHHPT
ncbi:MAG: helix-turn-helix domain-containing protein [Burkholderiales bacterium]